MTQASQPNITSLGTLTGLYSSANISAPFFVGAGNALSNVVISALNVTGISNLSTLYAPNLIGAGNALSNVQGFSVSGNVLSANSALVVTQASQPNITSLGTLTGLYSTGNLTATFFVGAGNALSNVVHSTLNVTGISNLSTLYAQNIIGLGNSLSNVQGSSVSGNVLSANSALVVTQASQPNITSLGTLTGLYSSANISAPFFVGAGNALSNVVLSTLNVTGTANILSDLTVGANLFASNIVSRNAVNGNIYMSANLIVLGNIYGSGGAVGGGSAVGSSQGTVLTLAGSLSLGTAFTTGLAGPGIKGYNIDIRNFTAQAITSVTVFSVGTGMIKFSSAGLYQVKVVLASDQPAYKIAVGSTSSSSFPPSSSGTSGYVYVANLPSGTSPSTPVTIPLNVIDVTKYYYLDAYFQSSATTLYQTAPPSGSTVGTNYGTYIQIAPFGSYVSSGAGIGAGLLGTLSAGSNLSGVYSSNAYRVSLTTANNWSVGGTSTAMSVTSNGNFQFNQTGVYQFSLCVNASGSTPAQFQVGSLASDSVAPGGTTPLYLYTYAPMYTQDPTSVITLPVNVTNISNVYFIECSFPGTVTGNVGLISQSTFAMCKPVGSYFTTSTSPWSTAGTSVYYAGGSVGVNAGPAGLTETLTVGGNTSFVGSLTTVTDQGSASYLTGLRTPAGSLGVQNYLTGSVPLTTTTSLINNYLSNAASIVSTAPTYNPALYLPGTSNSAVVFGSNHSTHFDPTNSNIFVEAWVYISSAASQWIMASSNITQTSGEDWGFLYNGTTINFYVFNTAGTTSQGFATGFSQNGWYHVAGSWNYLTKTAYAFVSGSVNAGTAITGSMRYFATNTITIGSYLANTYRFLQGYIFDLRFLRGSIVPTASFTAPSTPAVFSSAPTYVTGMNTGYSSNLALSLQSQYFPGASTSPYGPVLTLPGTAGSYYNAGVNSLFNSVWSTTGFTIEAWVNYASFANSNPGGWPVTLGHMQPTGGNVDWSLGASTTGQLEFYYNGNGSVAYVYSGANALITGQWTHIVVQCNALRIFLFINGIQRTDLTTSYTNTGTASAASIQAPALVNTTITPIAMGQVNSVTGPNFSIAKARLVFGTSGTNGNVYSSGSFTPSPNFTQTLPSGSTVAWQLESQYPLPTYPTLLDTPLLPSQASSYGAAPVVVGGVTPSALSPLLSYPTLDSINFTANSYIDYGNSASSVLNSNLWANTWTIEAWVYPTVAAGNVVSRSNLTTGVDWSIGLSGGTVNLYWGSSSLAGPAISLNQWTHIAATYDGTRANVYAGGTGTSTSSLGSQPFTATYGLQVGGPTSLTGNLADVRVSNVARYGGSTYTVPTAPFVTDSNTLLLLKSLGSQTGSTLEIQGRGLNATSIGAGRTTNAYPPAPMSSYLLDTTGNVAVTYGQGKYVVSASSEFSSSFVGWYAFSKNTNTNTFRWACGASTYNGTTGAYTGSVTTVDILGNSYSGEWIQLQMPVSIILSSMTFTTNYGASSLVVLGSRDGLNWNLVNSQSGLTAQATTATFPVQTSQAFNYFRIVNRSLIETPSSFTDTGYGNITFNGTDEGLCVTADSKVGVGIANPQRAMEIAGDLVVGGTISGGAGMGYFRNRIINGDMRIAQRGTSNVIPAAAAASFFIIDRFGFNSNFSTGQITQNQQTLTASDTPYQVGFRYSWRITTNIALTAASYGYAEPQQIIEGYNVSDLNWGTSFGSPITVSFWFRTNLAPGLVVSATIRGGAQYAFPFAVAGNGTWQYVTATVPPPPNGGTWGSVNGGGIYLFLGSRGLNSPTNPPNTWVTTNYSGTSLDCNPYALAGNYIEFTGVQLEKGTVATPFEFRPYGTELALCQRYYEILTFAGSSSGGTGMNTIVWGPSGSWDISYPYKVQKRVTNPTVTNNSAVTLSTGTTLSGTPTTNDKEVRIGLATTTGVNQIGTTGYYISYWGWNSSGNITVSAEL